MKNIVSFNFYELQVALSNATFYDFITDWTSKGVSTDTRTLVSGEIFIALKGENYDAHNLLAEAVNKEAAAVIISNEWYTNNKTIADKLNIAKVLVKDSFVALGELASFHRGRFDIPIIAIAGSNGKTTTKELIYTILSQKYNILKTDANFNNLIGVSHTLFSLTSETDIAVIEIGTNHPGEIIELCNILNPTHGLITNIGKEHLEYFNSLDEIEIEETFLYGYLLKTGGKAFINYDDERLKKYTKVLTKAITFGLYNDDSNNDNDNDKEINFAVDVKFDAMLKPTLYFKTPHSPTNLNMPVNINATGLAVAYNAIAASAVASIFLTDEELIKGLQAFIQTEHGYARMLISEINNILLLNDCYNANPSSMEMSLKTLSMLPNTTKKIAILGDMYELGEHYLEEHKQIIKTATNAANIVILTGDLMREAFEKLKNTTKEVSNVCFLDSFVHIKNHIEKQIINNNDKLAILIKGSRGMKMEQLIKLLKKEQ